MYSEGKGGVDAKNTGGSAARRGDGVPCSARFGRLGVHGVAPETAGAHVARERGGIARKTVASVRSGPAGCAVADDVSVASVQSSTSARSGFRGAHSASATPRNLKTLSRCGASSLTARRSVGRRVWNKSPSPPPQDPLLQHDQFIGDMGRATRSQPTRARDVPQLELELELLLQQQHGANPYAEDRNSPPRLLLAQDLRRERERQERLQTTPSPRTRVHAWAQAAEATRPHHASQVFSTVARDNGRGVAPLQRMHSAVVGGVPSEQDILHQHNEESLDGENDICTRHARSAPACRTSGPVVTEEWARSIVQPQDEYLLYERRTPGTTNHEKMVRCAQAVWMRERAQSTGKHHAAALGTSSSAATTDIATGGGGGGINASGAMPVLSAQRLPSERHPLLSTSVQGAADGAVGDTVRVRTIRMNERHIIARGTPLLFRQPRTQLFASDMCVDYARQRVGRGASVNGNSSRGNGNGDTVAGPKPNLQLQRDRSDMSIMASSLLHHGCNKSNKSDWSPTAISECNNASSSCSDEPKTRKGDTLSPSAAMGRQKAPFPHSGGLSSSSLPHSSPPRPPPPSSSSPSPSSPRPSALLDISNQGGDAAGGGKMMVNAVKEAAAVSLPASLLPDVGSQVATELFANPFFLLRSDENYERLLLKQAEHDARDVLLQQHATSLQLGRSVLSGGGMSGSKEAQRQDEEQQKRRYEVFVHIPPTTRKRESNSNAAVSPPPPPSPGPQQPKGDRVPDCRLDNTGFIDAVSREIVTSCTPAKGQDQEADEEVARYTVLGHMQRKRAAAPHSSTTVTTTTTTTTTTGTTGKKRRKTKRPGSASRAAAQTPPQAPKSSAADRMVKNGCLPNAEAAGGVMDTAHTALGQPPQAFPKTHSDGCQQMLEKAVQAHASSQGPQKTSSADAAGAGVNALKKAVAVQQPAAIRTEVEQGGSSKRANRSGSSMSSSRRSETWIIPHSESPDAELNEYVQFVLKKMRPVPSEGNGNAVQREAVEDDDAASVSFSSVGGGLFKNGKNTNRDAMFGAVCDDGMESLLLEDGGQYTQNVTCVLSAFGKMWQTMFHDTARHDELPIAVQAQLLLFDDPRPTDEDRSPSSSMGVKTDGDGKRQNDTRSQEMAAGGR